MVTPSMSKPLVHPQISISIRNISVLSMEVYVIYFALILPRSAHGVILASQIARNRNLRLTIMNVHLKGCLAEAAIILGMIRAWLAKVGVKIAVRTDHQAPGLSVGYCARARCNHIASMNEQLADFRNCKADGNVDCYPRGIAKSAFVPVPGVLEYPLL